MLPVAVKSLHIAQSQDYSRHISKQEFMDYFVPELEKLGSQSKVDDLLWNLEDGGRHVA